MVKAAIPVFGTPTLNFLYETRITFSRLTVEVIAGAGAFGVRRRVFAALAERNLCTSTKARDGRAPFPAL